MYTTGVDPGNENFLGYAYKGINGDGSIVLLLENLDLNYPANIFWSINNETKPYNADIYLLSPKDPNIINSTLIYVNDVLMEFNDGIFPEIKPVKGNGYGIILDPARIAFVILTPQ